MKKVLCLAVLGLFLIVLVAHAYTLITVTANYGQTRTRIADGSTLPQSTVDLYIEASSTSAVGQYVDVIVRAEDEPTPIIAQVDGETARTYIGTYDADQYFAVTVDATNLPGNWTGSTTAVLTYE